MQIFFYQNVNHSIVFLLIAAVKKLSVTKDRKLPMLITIQNKTVEHKILEKNSMEDSNCNSAIGSSHSSGQNLKHPYLQFLSL